MAEPSEAHHTVGDVGHAWVEATICHIALHPWQWLGFLMVGGIGIGLGLGAVWLTSCRTCP